MEAPLLSGQLGLSFIRQYCRRALISNSTYQFAGRVFCLLPPKVLPHRLADMSSHASSLSANLSQMRAGGCKLQRYQFLDHTSPCETGFSDRLLPRLEYGAIAAFRSHVGHHSVCKHSNFKSRISAGLLQSSVPNLTYDVIMSSELCLLESFQHFLLLGQLVKIPPVCLLESFHISCFRASL